MRTITRYKFNTLFEYISVRIGIYWYLQAIKKKNGSNFLEKGNETG